MTLVRLAAHSADIVKGGRLSEIAMHVIVVVHKVHAHIQTCNCNRCSFNGKECVDNTFYVQTLIQQRKATHRIYFSL